MKNSKELGSLPSLYPIREKRLDWRKTKYFSNKKLQEKRSYSYMCNDHENNLKCVNSIFHGKL